MATKKVIKKPPPKKKPKTKLGSFAGLTFGVSRKKLLTFQDFSRSDSYRWTDHEVLNGQPISEYNGADLSGIALKIELRKVFGLKPYETLTALRKFAKAGKTSAFLIGKKTVSGAKFKIESIGQAFEEIAPNGEVLKITLDLTLKQYNKPTVKKTSIKKPKSKKSTKKKKTAKSKQKATGTITIKAYMLNVRMSPSLKAKTKKVYRKGQKYRVYGTRKTDILWYKLAGGLYCSANSQYVSFKKG